MMKRVRNIGTTQEQERAAGHDVMWFYWNNQRKKYISNGCKSPSSLPPSLSPSPSLFVFYSLPLSLFLSLLTKKYGKDRQIQTQRHIGQLYEILIRLHYIQWQSWSNDRVEVMSYKWYAPIDRNLNQGDEGQSISSIELEYHYRIMKNGRIGRTGGII